MVRKMMPSLATRRLTISWDTSIRLIGGGQKGHPLQKRRRVVLTCTCTCKYFANQWCFREKNTYQISGATFQACSHENNTLYFVLYWTLCNFGGFFLRLSGANSPRAPVYFFFLWCFVHKINMFFIYYGMGIDRIDLLRLYKRECKKEIIFL